jgi:hypothetical protein
MGFWGTFCQPRLLPRTRSVPVTKTLPDHNEDRYQQVYENDNFEENKSSFGHEMIAGGSVSTSLHYHPSLTSTTGKPVSHQFAKELLAGFAGAEVDKLVCESDAHMVCRPNTNCNAGRDQGRGLVRPREGSARSQETGRADVR